MSEGLNFGTDKTAVDTLRQKNPDLELVKLSK